MKTYIFKTNLFYNKKIQREIEVIENASLYKLAAAIIKVYNFNFDHCFGFFSKVDERNYYDSDIKYELFADLEDQGIEPVESGSVKKTKIKEVWNNTGDKMLFLFDYGDNWLFVVELVGFGEKDNSKKYPKVLKKIGRAPKQY